MQSLLDWAWFMCCSAIVLPREPCGAYGLDAEMTELFDAEDGEPAYSSKDSWFKC